MESPDLFIDWGFYSLISAALQRRVWLYPDSMAIYPNVFTLLGDLTSHGHNQERETDGAKQGEERNGSHVPLWRRHNNARILAALYAR